jgi:hypothetical protein
VHFFASLISAHRCRQVAAALKNMVKAASEMRTLHNITVAQKATA